MNTSRSLRWSAPLLALTFGSASLQAEEWGAWSLVPVSAPALVLTAPAAQEAAAMVIDKPGVAGVQKWIVTPREGGLVSLHPAGAPGLALSAAGGGEKNGTKLVLETEAGQPWQRWTLTRQENGSYCLAPQHAPGQGMDDLGGHTEPGSPIDLWINKPGDQHLQWFIRSLAGSPAPAVATADEPAYEPPAIRPEAILPGATKQFTYTESKVFPGTVREVTVFIPAQYDGSRPACVYVKTDGYNPREKVLLETMIATGEIPVTVGVFVRPGDLPAPIKGTLGRRNRDFEYDGMGDNNVRFLADELLPYVARTLSLNLSTDGNDRCISGGSSGGIAAWTAAWERPEAFSRVYAASGSFVAFRGGHEYPTMVRKYEPKPIRGWFSTGVRDMVNCAGDWYLLDQEMDKALGFSGYDYRFRTMNGGHVAGYLDNWREAMAYLWKGWPERVKAGAGAPRVQDVLLPGEGWQPVAGEGGSVQGAAVDEKGVVYFADPVAGKIRTIGLNGQIAPFAGDSGHANGLTVGVDGRLYSVASASGKVTVWDAAGKGQPVADGLHAHSILAMPDGGFYLTGGGDVWRLKDGKKTKVAGGLKLATGLAYRPDQWLLSVADGASRWAWSYQIASDGSLTNPERYFWLHVPDGMDDAGAQAICYAREGQQFIATRAGLQVSADDGPTQVILPVPGNLPVTAVALGGPEGDLLYAFCEGHIFRRKVKCHGIGAFSPWVKVNGTKL